MVPAKIVTSAKLRSSIPPTYKLTLSVANGKTLYAYVQEKQIKTAMIFFGLSNENMTALNGASVELTIDRNLNFMNIIVNEIAIGMVCVIISEE